MLSLTSVIQKLSSYGTMLILAGGTLLASGSVAFADTPTCDPTPPDDSVYGAGVHHPIGADAGTYSYNCTNGTWSNSYYVYYPVSNSRTAQYSRNYGFSCATGLWSMDSYDFSPVDGAFHLDRVITTDPGGIATNCPTPVTSSTDPASPSSGGSTMSTTGPGSKNTTSGNTTLNNSTSNTNTLGMNNSIISLAGSGNAAVLGNTSGGSAGTGDAQGIANIANLLQSSSNAFGPGTATFTANINGDVTGDFMFDPSAIVNTGPGSTNSSSGNLQVNTNNTNTTNAQINNNINVGANSGNATVAGNTSGGNATSGNADAVVNLMNLINSTVAAGHSFIGTININGNLNGDILLPPGMLDQLLANTGPASTNTASTNLTDNSTTTNTTTEGVTNNITSTAQTGNANVSGNTSGGSATSGKASTNVTLLNLTGSNVVGKNDLLVFVNVLGKWVGVIMNAPSGSSAAELGGGISGSGPGSTNALNQNVTDNSTTTNTSNLGIANNVNVHAKSGDATVTNNTTGGNATSGNAATAVNVLNLEGSNLSLSNWFGVLFINVFGAWNGSFGVNTSAGDPVSNPTNNPVQAANQESMLSSLKTFASFTPHLNASVSSSTAYAGNTDGSVLGSTTAVAKKIISSLASKPAPDNKPHTSYLIPLIGICLAGAILVASERGRFFGNK